MPWILCGPGRAAGQHRRIFGLDRDNFHTGLARFEHLTDAGHRAAGADARDKDVDSTLSVVPDFLGGRKTVDFRIGWVFELLRKDRSGRRRDDFVGLGDSALHAERRGVSTSSAPSSASILRRSIDIDSGMTRINL